MSLNWKHLAIGLGSVIVVLCAIAATQHRKAATAPGAAVVDVFNSIEGRSTVLASQPDGTRVAKGDTVCELDPSPLEERLANQKTVILAAEHDLQDARLSREAAILAVTEYRDGRFRQDLIEADGEVTLAEASLARSEDHLNFTRRLFNKGYATVAEKTADELMLKRARSTLERAQSKKNVLLDSTRDKTTKALLSAVEAAKARELSKQAALQREQSVNKRLADQIRRCTIVAPVSGYIRYAVPIAPGAVVHDGQVLFRVIYEATPGPAAR